MGRLRIRHETRYVYDRPVGFGPHRLLTRPRDSHAIRLLEASLTLSPPGDTRWVYDALGNSVCWFTPQGQASALSIVSDLVIQRYPASLAPLATHDPRSGVPVDYGLADRAVLAPFCTPADGDVEGLAEWLQAKLGAPGEPALDLLLRLTTDIRGEFDYRPRQSEGVQSPAQTLAHRSGTCRDFAWLMTEALRRSGFAARFVTGYLYSPGGNVRGAGATHAWCEAFLPELGWMEFDPTNGLAESPELIPVAVARTPAEAAPVCGTLIGGNASAQLTVSVTVTAESGPGEVALA